MIQSVSFSLSSRTKCDFANDFRLNYLIFTSENIDCIFYLIVFNCKNQHKAVRTKLNLFKIDNCLILISRFLLFYFSASLCLVVYITTTKGSALLQSRGCLFTRSRICGIFSSYAIIRKFSSK